MDHVVYSLFVVDPILCVVFVLVCFAVLCVFCSFAIIALGNREPVVYMCCVMNVMLMLSFLYFIAVQWGKYIVCDCGISWSYSLTFCRIEAHMPYHLFEMKTETGHPLNCVPF